MTCNVDARMIDAYVDESLAPDDLASLEDHMRDCPSCAGLALNRLQAKRATRAAAANLSLAPEFQMRPEFRLKIEKSLANGTKTRSAKTWLPWLAAAAALLVVVLAVNSLVGIRARNQAMAEAVDLHVVTLASANPVDVVSTDRHTVKPWFAGRIPFAFNLPELQDSPYKLLGGKVAFLHGSPGAELLFELRKHQISVFIVQEQPGIFGAGSDVVSAKFRGFSDETWSDAGLRYIVVSDTTPGDVHALGDLFRSATR